MGTESKLVCGYCGEELSEDERESPRMAGDEPLCDDCWREHFSFLCDCCENNEHEKLQHYYLVVYEKMSGGLYGPVVPGIYYIAKRPYYRAPLIGHGDLFKDALLRLRDLPGGGSQWQGMYPCGHLCRDCVGQLRLPTTQKYRDMCRKNPY